MKFKIYTPLCAALIAVTVLFPTVALASRYRLVEIQGTVQIKRRWSLRYRAATPGMTLRLGDRLRTGPQSLARIQCSDLSTIWPMHSNLTRGVAADCPNRSRSDLRIGRQTDSAAGGEDSNVPYIISPRRTAVLDSPLTLRWNPIPGAISYTVQIVGPNKQYWETTVNNAEATYPETALLSSAEDYSVVVEPNVGSSSQEDAGANIASFHVLHSWDVSLVQEKIEALSKEDLSEEAYRLALADIYIHEDLLADAIDTLEPLVSGGSELFDVHRTLGDLYRYVGLNLLAESRYEKAIILAAAHEDLEGQADSQACLAEVKLMLARPTEVAVGLLNQALVKYRETLASYETLALKGEEALEENIRNELEEELQERIQDVEERLEELTPSGVVEPI